MKLLVYEWTSFTNFDLYLGLQADKIPFHIARIPFSARKKEEQENFMEKLEELIKKDSYDAVFSINFFDCIAQVCYNYNILYISWSYDSPSLGGRVSTHFYSTNRIFLFDSAELERHQKMGKQHLYHLNLAVNPERMNQLKSTPLERVKYQSDISFVGQLYTVELQQMLGCLDEYSASYLSALVDIQRKVYRVNLLSQLITKEIVDFVKTPEFEKKIREFGKEIGGSQEEINPGTLELLLLKAVTNRERVLLLALLSKYHQVKLFSGDRHQVLENVIFGGKVDYLREMPKVFHHSKINLNITLRSIEAGIPLRCLDILGCHGFLITNYQKDLFTELEDGKDLVVYENMEDAVEKTTFYLKNEKARKEIAKNGYKKIKDCFNYHRQLSKIWEITGLQ